MTSLRRFLIIAGLAVLGFASVASAQAPTGASAAEVKRITDRYALTRTRISNLLDLRLHPVPVPGNPPNPFYQPPKEVAEVHAPEPEVALPETADITDIDTLRKFAGGLKVGGLITRAGVQHVTINNTACKVGDIITVGSRDRPTYLKLVALNPGEFTLGLNEATLTIPLRK